MQKLAVLLCTNSEQSEKESNSIYNSIKKKKNLRINLTKEVKDMCTENKKYCWKKLKRTSNNWKTSLVHASEDVNNICIRVIQRNRTNSVRILPIYLSSIYHLSIYIYIYLSIYLSIIYLSIERKKGKRFSLRNWLTQFWRFCKSQICKVDQQAVDREKSFSSSPKGVFSIIPSCLG